MISTRWMAGAAALLSAVAPAAWATDRYYPDSFAVSPNGRYRIDATSPDNAGAMRRPFAANFTYRLKDLTTGKVLWERKQPMERGKGRADGFPSEMSPVDVFVNDEGLVAARTAWDTLVIMDGASGRKRGEADVLRAFPADEQNTFVSHSTAGPIWAQDSDWFFLTLPATGTAKARTVFVVRPYWNHRLVIDTATAAQVDLGKWHSAANSAALGDASATQRQLLDAIMVEERRRALATLERAPERLKGKIDYDAYWSVSAALRTTAFLRLFEAERQVRVLEKFLTPDQPSELDSLRKRVRETLRCLGKVPAEGYGVRLYPRINNGSYWTQDTEHPYNASVSAEARIANASKVVEGISTKEMTDLIGCPDAEFLEQGQSFDYDIDAPTPFTLRVTLDQNGDRVTRVRKIEPPAYLHISARRSW